MNYSYSDFFRLAIVTLLVSVGLTAPIFSQTCAPLALQEEADIGFDCGHLPMTMKQDRMGRALLYVAAKEAGLRIYDITLLSQPFLLLEIPIGSMGNLQVMNLHQQGNFLYLALGSHFVGGEQAGFAIVDVSIPGQAFVTDFWVHSQPGGGAGIVEVHGDYAYLGAMEDGLIIFDIANPAAIDSISQFIPDIQFPEANPDPAKYNIRGMNIQGDILYLCYDAGGIRIINTSDKLNPIETGRYSNPVFNGIPRAYNNIFVRDSLAYVTVDYCGLEILNISDTANITQVSWWNPWNCETNLLNWFSSPGHTNEIALSEGSDLLFMSTGKSDMHVVNVQDPTNPDSCDTFGGPDNSIGTWGIDVYEDRVFLSYICSLIPFTSNWAGIKILRFNRPTTSLEKADPPTIRLYPNPASDQIKLTWEGIDRPRGSIHIQIFNMKGQSVEHLPVTADFGEAKIDVESLPAGLYHMGIRINGTSYSRKFLKQVPR